MKTSLAPTHSHTEATNVPKAISPKPPRLLALTITSFLTTIIVIGLAHYSYSYPLRLLPLQLRDLLHVFLTPLIPALNLFLLHRLLEITILHRTFRPTHLLSGLAVLLSLTLVITTSIAYAWAILYLIASVIFTASLSFQKSHSLATNPTYLHSSLLATAVASLALGLINFFIFAISSSSTNTVPVGLLIITSISIILPLELALTFLCLAKLSSARSTTSTTNPAHSVISLSRLDRFILAASFFISITSFTTYLAIATSALATDYSQHQPCCQPIN